MVFFPDYLSVCLSGCLFICLSFPLTDCLFTVHTLENARSCEEFKICNSRGNGNREEVVANRRHCIAFLTRVSVRHICIQSHNTCNYILTVEILILLVHFECKLCILLCRARLSSCILYICTSFCIYIYELQFEINILWYQLIFSNLIFMRLVIRKEMFNVSFSTTLALIHMKV